MMFPWKACPAELIGSICFRVDQSQTLCGASPVGVRQREVQEVKPDSRVALDPPSSGRLSHVTSFNKATEVSERWPALAGGIVL